MHPRHRQSESSSQTESSSSQRKDRKGRVSRDTRSSQSSRTDSSAVSVTPSTTSTSSSRTLRDHSQTTSSSNFSRNESETPSGSSDTRPKTENQKSSKNSQTTSSSRSSHDESETSSGSSDSRSKKTKQRKRRDSQTTSSSSFSHDESETSSGSSDIRSKRAKQRKRRDSQTTSSSSFSRNESETSSGSYDRRVKSKSRGTRKDSQITSSSSFSRDASEASSGSYERRVKRKNGRTESLSSSEPSPSSSYSTSTTNSSYSNRPHERRRRQRLSTISSHSSYSSTHSSSSQPKGRRRASHSTHSSYTSRSSQSSYSSYERSRHKRRTKKRSSRRSSSSWSGSSRSSSRSSVTGSSRSAFESKQKRFSLHSSDMSSDAWGDHVLTAPLARIMKGESSIPSAIVVAPKEPDEVERITASVSQAEDPGSTVEKATVESGAAPVVAKKVGPRFKWRESVGRFVRLTDEKEGSEELKTQKYSLSSEISFNINRTSLREPEPVELENCSRHEEQAASTVASITPPSENDLDSVFPIDSIDQKRPRQSQMPIPRAMMMSSAARQGQPKMASRPLWASEVVTKSNRSENRGDPPLLSPRARWNESQKKLMTRPRLIEGDNTPQLMADGGNAKSLDADRVQDARAQWNSRQMEELRRTSAYVAEIQREKYTGAVEPITHAATVRLQDDLNAFDSSETGTAKMLRLQWNQRQKQEAHLHLTQAERDRAERLEREKLAKQNWNKREKKRLGSKDEAAVRIQSLVRMKMACRRVQRVMAERRKARRLQEEAIQAAMEEERRREEENAIAMRHRWLEGKWVTFVMKSMDDRSEQILMERYARKDEAAWRIQAIWKGRGARIKFQICMRVIRHLQASWRSHLLRQKLRDAAYLGLRRKAEHQAAIERVKQVEAQKREVMAAVKIQSLMRARIAKKRVNFVRETQRNRSDGTSMLPNGLNDPQMAAIHKRTPIYSAAELRAIKKQQALEREHERIEAAVLIQSRYRGNVARKKVELVKRIKLREELRLQLQKKEVMDRRKRMEREAKVNAAAVTIQSRFRGFLARKRFRSRWLQNELQNGMSLCRIDELLRHRQALGMEFEDESAIREEKARLKRQALERKIEMMEKNRAEQKEQETLRRNRAALNIQRLWRGKVVRKRMREESLRRLNLEKIKAKLKATETADSVKRNEAAVKLQSAFRGHQARKRALQLRRQLQAKREKAALVKKMNMKHRAAIKIQSAFRRGKEKIGIARMLSAGGRKELSSQFVEDAAAVRDRLNDLMERLTDEYEIAAPSEKASLAENSRYLGNGRYRQRSLSGNVDGQDTVLMNAWAEFRKLQEAMPEQMRYQSEYAEAMEKLRVALLSETKMSPHDSSFANSSRVASHSQAYLVGFDPMRATPITPQEMPIDAMSTTLSRGFPPSRRGQLFGPSSDGSPHDLYPPDYATPTSRAVPTSTAGGQTPSKNLMYSGGFDSRGFPGSLTPTSRGVPPVKADPTKSSMYSDLASDSRILLDNVTPTSRGVPPSKAGGQTPSKSLMYSNLGPDSRSLEGTSPSRQVMQQNSSKSQPGVSAGRLPQKQ